MASDFELSEEPDSYFKRLQTEIANRRAAINYSQQQGGHRDRMSPPRADQHLPFSVTIDGNPYETVTTVSVGNGRGKGAEHGQAGVEKAINEASATFAIVRKPYSDELFVLPVTNQEAASGACYLDSTAPEGQERGLSPLNQETPFSAKVAVGQDQWAMPTQLDIKWDRGAFDINAHGNPEGLATIVQSLPPVN